MHAIQIINGTIWSSGTWLENAALTAVDGRITSVGPKVSPPEGTQVIDAHGCYVIPGFVEAHMHGCGGCDFMDATSDAFATIAETAVRHGVTSLAVTTVACAEQSLYDLFDTYRARDEAALPLDLVGIHLEGPFLSEAMRGAQSLRHIRKPTAREVDALLERGDGIILRCSAAPEIDGAEEMARKMRNKGIALSVAHSDATCEQILRAFDDGFDHITHLYSNTPSVRKIDQVVHAGVVEAAYLLDGMTVELIGDGHHVPKELLWTALKIKGVERTMLITDAMRAAGTDATESYLGEPTPANRVIIEDGVAKLPDRSFYAGSIATSDQMLRTMVQQYEIPLEQVIPMMTEVPARHLRIDDRKGALLPGMDADIVLLSPALDIQAVLSRGRLVHNNQTKKEMQQCELA